MTRVSGDYKVQKIIKRIHKLSRLCMIYISVTNNTVLLPFFCGCWSNLFATIYLWGFCYRRFIKRYLFNNKHRITYHVHKRARCFDNVLMHFFHFIFHALLFVTNSFVLTIVKWFHELLFSMRIGYSIFFPLVFTFACVKVFAFALTICNCQIFKEMSWLSSLHIEKLSLFCQKPPFSLYLYIVSYIPNIRKS